MGKVVGLEEFKQAALKVQREHLDNTNPRTAYSGTCLYTKTDGETTTH